MLYTMTISEKIYKNGFDFFSISIPLTIIFRIPCTWLILLFTAFSLLFYKKINFKKENLLKTALIASPFLLEILFFWNNDSYSLGVKTLEKSLSLLVFPLFILGNYKQVNFYRLIKIYSIVTTAIVLFFFFRFIVVYPEYFNKYLNGIHLWEMGYVFSKTIGMHAPALNMHMAFVTIINFYIFIKKENGAMKYLYFFIFITSFFLLLFINTRVAIIDAAVGCIIVLFYQLKRKENLTKLIINTGITILFISILSVLFLKKDSYLKEKFSNIAFAHMDKVGKLDEIDHPEVVVYSSLVTRVSIWKSALELSWKALPFGVGSSDGRNDLVNYYKQTNQKFLAKYKFATHNQYIDFLLKFGFIGLIVAFAYIFSFLYFGIKSQNPLIVAFFFLFFTCNLTDDFLIRFDGIIFSGFWLTIFSCYYMQKVKTDYIKNT
jgi:hypothetical protein